VPFDRPQLVLMVYLLFVAGAVTGAIVMFAAACHMAIGDAFTAGLRAHRPEAPGSSGHTLRVVE
jgi:hypothetical protein